MNYGGELVRYSVMPSTQSAPHYGFLLCVLLVLWAVAPLVPNRADYVVEFFFDLVLVTGAYSAAWRSRHRVPFLAVTGVTLAIRWVDMIVDHGGFSLASVALGLAWLVYAVGLIVATLFRMQRVSVNAILGAIVAYMLAAIAFAVGFELIEWLEPSSFTGLPAAGSQRELEHALLYFSFVSITTMGYGDILPVSELARSSATLEGVFGTLYLAVMIAKLVGLHGATASEE